MRTEVEADRHIDPAKHAIHSFATVDQFLATPEIRNGVNTIWHGGLPIDFHFTGADSNALVVMFHGAVLKTVNLPWFTGSGVTKDLGVNRIMISDPSLYLDRDVSLAWFSGNKFQPDLQNVILSIFKKVAETVGADRVVLFGTSGGGFATLLYSYFIPGSTAIAVNPQTNLKSHSKNTVGRWLNLCWGVDLLEQLPEETVTDLIDLYSSPADNRVLYMQNSTDFHVWQHMNPFLRGADLESVQVLMGAWKEGHLPPPKELITDVLQNACGLPYEAPLEGFAPASRP